MLREPVGTIATRFGRIGTVRVLYTGDHAPEVRVALETIEAVAFAAIASPFLRQCAAEAAFDAWVDSCQRGRCPSNLVGWARRVLRCKAAAATRLILREKRQRIDGGLDALAEETGSRYQPPEPPPRLRIHHRVIKGAHLTSRQKRILTCVRAGQSTRSIARECCCSPRDIRRALARIVEKIRAEVAKRRAIQICV